MLSGRSGATLFTREVTIEQASRWTQPQMVNLGDLDCDGTLDLALYHVSYRSPSVELVALPAAKLGRCFRIEYPEFVHTITSTADVSGDSQPDLVFAGIGYDRTVEVRSGLDGELLYSVAAPPEGYFGEAIALLGDLDGDAAPDFLISTKTADDPDTPGAFVTISGRDGKRIGIHRRRDLLRGEVR